MLGLLAFAVSGCARKDSESQSSDLAEGLEYTSCPTVNLDQFFSFTISDELRPIYFGHDYDPGDQWNSDSETVNLIKSALQEILNTPEGFQLISSAVTRFNGNKIHFDIDDFREVGEADAFSGTPFIRVSNSWAARSVTYNSNGRNIQLTMQRLLVHELYHLSAGHVTGGPQAFDARRQQYEAETVAFTDSYMHKYYNEPPKGNYNNASINGGTDRWDYARKTLGCSASI
ncbi:MAG: hypothetical protein HRT94_07410 [Alphaproteobacteria bacterium]|nr:hypothetical protein [Alphaproteobacteria bacterium]